MALNLKQGVQIPKCTNTYTPTDSPNTVDVLAHPMVSETPETHRCLRRNLKTLSLVIVRTDGRQSIMVFHMISGC